MCDRTRWDVGYGHGPILIPAHLPAGHKAAFAAPAPFAGMAGRTKEQCPRLTDMMPNPTGGGFEDEDGCHLILVVFVHGLGALA